MYLLHFAWYLLKHKFFVAYFKLHFFPQVSWKQVILHDLDKALDRNAFKAYARDFAGYPDRESFNYAFTHIHTQPHHWERWTAGRSIKPMPTPYREEMLCDWLSAATVKSGSPSQVFDFWFKHNKAINLHPVTRKYVVATLKSLVGKL